MIRGEPYTYDADMWAFGVFVFEMLMGMIGTQCLWSEGNFIQKCIGLSKCTYVLLTS